MHTPISLSYEAGLSAQELDRALRRLLDCQRRCEWLLCRYLADIADGARFRELGWYSDALHCARERFGLSVKCARDRIRIGRALRELPLIEEGFVEGELGFSKVRELTRVASPEDEAEWLAVATRVSVRELERRVAGTIGGEAACDGPAQARWTSPETVELTVRMAAGSWALLSRAMEGARLATEGSLSDAQALEAVAREALARLNEPDGTTVADPRRAVVVYRCGDCGQSELETNAGAVGLSVVEAARLCCGATEIDLATEGKAEACVGGSIPAAVRRAVMARDRGRCRLCGRRRYVDVHHQEPQSEGGAHSRDNCLCLCTGCHGATHSGELRIEGCAEGELSWFDKEGNELGSEARTDAPRGASVGPDCQDAPRGASLGDDLDDAPRGAGGANASPHAAQVLRAMGARGGWHLDELVRATELSVHHVSGALLELQLGGQVRSRDWGLYEPAGLGGRAARMEPAPTTWRQPSMVAPPPA